MSVPWPPHDPWAAPTATAAPAVAAADQPDPHRSRRWLLVAAAVAGTTAVVAGLVAISVRTSGLRQGALQVPVASSAAPVTTAPAATSAPARGVVPPLFSPEAATSAPPTDVTPVQPAVWVTDDGSNRWDVTTPNTKVSYRVSGLAAYRGCGPGLVDVAVPRNCLAAQRVRATSLDGAVVADGVIFRTEGPAQASAWAQEFAEAVALPPMPEPGLVLSSRVFPAVNLPYVLVVSGHPVRPGGATASDIDRLLRGVALVAVDGELLDVLAPSSLRPLR